MQLHIDILYYIKLPVNITYLFNDIKLYTLIYTKKKKRVGVYCIPSFTIKTI